MNYFNIRCATGKRMSSTTEFQDFVMYTVFTNMQLFLGRKAP